eukprot:2781276-Amphidinium_carterae.1
MVYVDDLLVLGEDDKIKEFLQRLQSQLQLKHVTKLERGQPLVTSLSRKTDRVLQRSHRAQHDEGILQFTTLFVQHQGE